MGKARNVQAYDGKDPKDQGPRNKKDKYTRQVRQASTMDGQKWQRTSAHVTVDMALFAALWHADPIWRANV